ISMGPIAIVAAAVAGLVYVVAKNWDKIKSVITGAATAVLNFIKARWPLIVGLLTGPVGLAVVGIAKNWDKIKSKIDDVVGWFKKLPGRIVRGIGDVGSKLVQKGKDFIAGFGRGAEEKAKSLPFGMGKVIG